MLILRRFRAMLAVVMFIAAQLGRQLEAELFVPDGFPGVGDFSRRCRGRSRPTPEVGSLVGGQILALFL